MISIRKNKVQVLVIGVLIFLTLNCFVLGQPPMLPPEPPVPSDTSENQAPKILSIEISGRQNYQIKIEIEDEDPDTVTSMKNQEGESVSPHFCCRFYQ
jgi:hypothetical protein